MKRLPAPLRKILPPSLVLLTAALFVYLFAKHPEYRHTLATANPWTLLLIAALYAVMIGCVNWVNDITLRLCGTRLKRRENILLTCYTSIINFFGPLQSGPAMRAAYLKQRLHLRMRDYTLVSLVYYAFYAIISALFLLTGSGSHWPIALFLVLGVTAGCAVIVFGAYKKIVRPGNGSTFKPTVPLLAELFIATLCQLAVTALIYFVELRAVHTNASWLQAVTYGGAANFALFVALTPGAIGFREAFLQFSRQLHHISTGGILAASVIDRAVFVVFLGLMFLLIVSLHLNKQLARAAKTATEQ